MYPIDLFHRQAARTPDRIAVEFGDARMTYADLAARVGALATGLQAIDPEPQSRVGICCFNHVEHVVAWLAVLAAGKVWVPLYPKNKAAEIGLGIAFTEASIVIADAPARSLVEGAGGTILVADRNGRAGTTGGLAGDHAGSAPRFHPLPLHATQAIKFTGGTTGKPKGVMQPYRAWNTNIATQVAAWGLQAGDRLLAAAPITHGTSTYILPTLGTGGTLVLLDQPRPDEILHCLAEGEIATTFLPPTVIYMMMALPAARRGAYPHLRNLVYGSAAMRPDAIAEAQSVFGPCIASTYGQTEAPQIATMISAAELARPDKRATVGRETMLTRVAILDPEGTILPTGAYGEIAIRGDLVMTGYWKQPDKTAETIRDGWLHTGDLGSFDADGFLSIKGRAKDLIITGGFNVYPADVEPVLGQHAAVSDCAIFGVPDDKWGEAVHGAIELRDGMTADPEEIIRFVKDRLGSVKTPKSIVVYKSLPRNNYGKLQKQVLVEDHIARAAQKRQEP
ncbi:class I adenylate-forming enzyme family protein [Methylobacterium sp. J-070]|uniref:class I adenylate-forming enzyme family protein n=1 Tax=Methylobacterium sp. J-070 TaxID=2836650 RepID=UPI001FBBB661|nr:AMP-binding protein [Methylobacterium sp. J-070]MCJ2050378.1 AMP-binding protein [Methylobacterium sp. J-070]